MFRTGSSTSSTEPPARRPVPRTGGRRARAAVLAALLAAGLAAGPAGCGFTPLHGERSRASAAALTRFDIAIIADRTGQMLRNELLKRMDPRDSRTGPRPYTLRITLTENRSDLGIRIDESATRANLTLTADFTVTGADPATQSYSGRAIAVMSHNILSSDYATLAARTDARKRGVIQLADSLTERLSIWLINTGGTFERRPDAAPASGVRRP